MRTIKLPFRIDRDSSEPLISQFAHGLARGIETGFWKPGDVLPTLDEFAAAAGVSVIVVRHAVRRVVKDGLVNPRPGVGTVVLDGMKRLWRGHVVIVDFEMRSNYFFTRVSGILRERLINANYLPSAVSVAAEAYDMGPLCAMLRQPVNLAVVLGDGHGHSGAVLDKLDETEIPAIAFSSLKRMPGNVAGVIRMDSAAAMSDFVDDCVRRGVKRVAEIRLRPASEYPRRSRLGARGVASETWRVEPFGGADPIENVQRGTMDFFEERLSLPDPDLPDVLYFDDDYAASAAIVSLLRHGVKVPEDVSVVAQVHRGCPPPYPVPLQRIEDDPFLAGDRLSALALDFLAGKGIPRLTELPMFYRTA